jgi:2,4-dienoyl-CoA reductase-like NADH-dependent reductase (Old Yellow Enzyme family)
MKTARDFLNRLDELNIQLPFDEELATDNSPLAASIPFTPHPIGNRFAILPMEGWDGTSDGKPTDLTRRRWQNFGHSGAKLIWGGEAVAVRHDGRANPNQLVINQANLNEIANLRELLVAAHQSHGDRIDDLLIGLQLTHSGRFARPNEKQTLEPHTAYRHPLLDAKFSVPESALLSDDDLKRLRDDFISAAKLAHQAGFAFVDIKHCHGYLGHELLSGVRRPGKYGGSFENRTRLLREIVAGIQSEAAGLQVGVRISIFDFIPFQRDPTGNGIPAEMFTANARYDLAFGGDGSGQGIDLEEPHLFMDLLASIGIRLVCTTAGSPYYNPHIQRPAAFPPSDGYLPPEDPLVGVARQIQATAELKRRHPSLIFVGSAYSYLQEWLPNVAQAVVANGSADSIGLGRMVLSYPELPRDVIGGSKMQRKKICRTFSDCTTAPRNGIVSGCYPLDPFYKSLPQREQLLEIKSTGLPGRGE